MEKISAEYQESVGRLVEREVIYCVSYLISELGRMDSICQQMEEDYLNLCGGYRQCEECEGYGIVDIAGESVECPMECDDGERLVEVYEHWIVSGWLFERLQERGEVCEDFMGMKVWGRQTTGQGILLDSVICEIHDALKQD